MKNGGEFLRKYWFMVVFLVGIIGTSAVTVYQVQAQQEALAKVTNKQVKQLDFIRKNQQDIGEMKKDIEWIKKSQSTTEVDIREILKWVRNGGN